MKTLIMEGSDLSNMKLMVELAQKLNLKAQIINSEEREDLALEMQLFRKKPGNI